MQQQFNLSLRKFNTFGIDVTASEFCSILNPEDVRSIVNKSKLPILVLGGGSNVLFTKNQDCLVVHNEIKGIEVTQESRSHIKVKIGGGVLWHEFVIWCVKNNFGGVENLSLIPGTVGAAPIQNIGAYGVELVDVFDSLEAVDFATGSLLKFDKDTCKFGYRDSTFKQTWKGKLIITHVYLNLTKINHKLSYDYAALKEELQRRNIQNPGIADISNAVIAVRQSKLPDPEILGNAGSFFKNPEITVEHLSRIQTIFPDIPHFNTSDGFVKIPAGWLIENRGWKGKKVGNCGMHERQALVMVNYGKATGDEILKLANNIIDDIQAHFGIKLSPEVNIL